MPPLYLVVSELELIFLIDRDEDGFLYVSYSGENTFGQ